ncbi:MAG TPA: hypothetical protein VGJ63_08200 [Micromonosporaceae bacterium]|jgi:hypothetical protein
MISAVAAGRAVRRADYAKNVDSLSGSAFERVIIGGEGHVLKRIGRDLDWIMRAVGDGTDGAPPWAVSMWRNRLLDVLPVELDHTVVGMAHDGTGRFAILMRDVGDAMVPPGSARIPLAQHRGFLDHMAAMHVRFFPFEDDFGLMPLGARYAALTPEMSAREAAAGHDDPVPRAVPTGWAALREAAAPAYEIAYALGTDPAPLAEALAETPATLIHGDWKYGNLGSHGDGRTVLLDWGWPGRAGPCVDLAWYLAVNCDRLPESKQDAAGALRDALERGGLPTAGWWDRQLELALVGGFVQLGWSKTNDPAELGWWIERVLPVGRDLLR